MNTFNTIIIGGGQAGLSASYFLTKAGIDHIVLEKHARIGDQWRQRWDSLKLFTPAQYNHLPGAKFPAPKGTFPGKEEVADFLENYAQEYQMPIQCNTEVREVSKQEEQFIVSTNTTPLKSDNVIVATGAFQKPFIPNCHKNIPEKVLQLHSSEYKNPGQLQPGKVLVAGTGNSGVQIAEELSREYEVLLSGRDNTGLPRIFLGKDIYWWLSTTGLLNASIHSPIVKRMKKKMMGKGDPLVGRNLQKISEKCGLQRLSKVVKSQNGHLLCEKGELVDLPANIIWATGYHPDFSYIHLPVFDENGHPRHERGIAKNTEGLYFLGLRLLYRLNSSLIGGVGKDAEFIATHIEVKQ